MRGQFANVGTCVKDSGDLTYLNHLLHIIIGILPLFDDGFPNTPFKARNPNRSKSMCGLEKLNEPAMASAFREICTPCNAGK